MATKTRKKGTTRRGGMKRLAVAILFQSVFLSAFYPVSYYIDDFYVRIHINKDSSYDVEENISFSFSEASQGITRTIPSRFVDSIRVQGLQFTAVPGGGGIRLIIGSKDKPLDDRVLFNIRYHVENAVLFTSNGCVFSWSFTNEWDSAINKVGFTILLPEKTALRPADLTVRMGWADQSAYNVFYRFDGRVLSGNSTKWLGRKEGIRVEIRLPRGSLKEPDIARRFFILAGAYPALVIAPCAVLAAGAVVLAVVISRKIARKRKKAP